MDSELTIEITIGLSTRSCTRTIGNLEQTKWGNSFHHRSHSRNLLTVKLALFFNQSTIVKSAPTVISASPKNPWK